MANGCKLAWLINPKDETVFTCRPNQPVPEVMQGFDRNLSGEMLLVDFQLDLSELR
jgi:Uma2 family endonuclease